MKKNCLFLVVFCFSLSIAAAGLQSPGAAQAPAATGFPAQLLEGTDDFNLAINIYGDSRGNFGPCG